MKSLFIILCAALVFPIVASGVMDPYYHSVEDIKAILESEEVVLSLREGGSIRSIVYENRAFTVTAGSDQRGCTIQAEVLKTSPPDYVGEPFRRVRLISSLCWRSSHPVPIPPIDVPSDPGVK